MKLRHFLMSVFVVLAITPIALLIAWPHSHVFETEMDEVRNRHLLLARSLADTLAHYHDDLLSTFNLLIRELSVGHETNSATLALDNLSIRHICTVDAATGVLRTVVASRTDTPCPLELTPLQLGHLNGILVPDQTTFGPVMSAPDGTNVIHMVSSIGGDIAFGVIDTDFFRELGQSISFGERGHATIVDQHGNVLSHMRDDWTAARRNIAEIPIVQRMMNGEAGADHYHSAAIDGEMIAGFTSVQPVRWGVMVPQPVAELEAKASAAVKSVAAVFLIGTFGAIALAVWVSVLTARPLEWISDLSESVAGGDLSLPATFNAPFLLPIELRRAPHNLRHMVIRLRKTMESVNRLAYLDQGTGLANREFFKRRLSQVLGGEGPVDRGTLLFIDLDGFKAVNDTHGHDAGDAALSEVADRMRSVLDVPPLGVTSDPLTQANAHPEAALVARLGGDEFAVFLPDKPLSDVEHLASRLITEISKPLELGLGQAQLGASIGIARFPDHGTTTLALLKAGDLAMYEAKSLGKGQMVTFHDDMRKEQLDQRDFGKELRWAVELDQLIPVFQPQYDAASRDLVGVEALVRWNHPTRGWLEPGDFLDVAADLGLSAEIDRIVLRKSVAAMTALHAAGAGIPCLSVNISSERLASSELLRDVVELGDLPFQVKFELLETIFLDTIDNRTAATIQRLDGLGIHMEMDDFGSGHASIIALLNLRPSTVKIDGRLVARIAEDDYRHRIVRSIVDLVTSLDINVTAEGVETEEQARILTEIGCHTLQGHYFSYPLSESALLQALGSDLGQRQSGDGSAS